MPSPFHPGRFAWWHWLAPLVLLVLTTPLWLHWWEPQMFMHINAWCRWVPDSVWTGLSLLGNGWGVLVVTAPLLLLAPRQMWAWLCAAPFAALFARLGKGLLVSPRPAADIDNAQMHIVGEVLRTVSMPSGHTTTAFAVATALVLSLPPAQRPSAFWLVLLALATGLSRIAVGAHWPGDVAVGVALGWWSGLLGNRLLVHVPPTWSASNHWAMRCVAALVAVAAFMLCSDRLDFAENQPLQVALAAFAACVLLVFVVRSVRQRPGQR